MAIELKELLTSLGLDADPEKLTADEFKTQVGAKYVLRDEVLKDEEIKTKFTGHVFSKLSTKAAQEFGLTSGEVKDKKMEEIFTIVKGKYDVKIAELTEQAGKGNDKKVEELTAKLTTLQSELGLKENGLKEWETKYNTEVEQKEKTLRNYKLTDKISKVQTSLTDRFTDEYKKNELVRTGFEKHLSDTYEFDLDDKDAPIVKLKADGTVVKSKKTIGHAATPEEIFLQEMESKGVLKKNNAKEEKIITKFAIEGEKGKVKVHPNAQRNAERLS
jgi:hypothetical protein